MQYDKVPIGRQKQLSFPTGDEGRELADYFLERNSGPIDAMLGHVNFHDGISICDIGCGPGYSLVQMSTKVKSGFILGIDPSEVMLEEAKKLNEDNIRKGIVELKEGKTPDLDVENMRFDYVTAANVIYFWKDLKPHFKEIARILKPGGAFLAFVVSNDTLKEKYADDGVFNVYEFDEIESVGKETGFESFEAYYYEDENGKKGHILELRKKE